MSRKVHPRARIEVATGASAAAVVLLVASAFALLFVGRAVLCAVLAGAVIGIAFRPIVARATKLGLSRRNAGVAVFGAIAVVFSGLLVWGAPIASAQLATLGTRLPDALGELQVTLLSSSSAVVAYFAHLLPPLLQSPAVTDAGPVLERAAELVSDIAAIGYTTLLVLVFAATWDDASATGRRAISRMLTPLTERSLCRFVDDAEARMGAFVRGQLLVCGLSATIATGSYLALGVPYAYLLGPATGALEIVPVLGPIAAAALVLGACAVAVPQHLVWLALIVIANHALQSYIVAPRVMDRAVGVSPFAMLLSVAVFSVLLGPAGAVLAVPLASLFQLALDRFVPAEVLATRTSAQREAVR